MPSSAFLPVPVIFHPSHSTSCPPRAMPRLPHAPHAHSSTTCRIPTSISSDVISDLTSDVSDSDAKRLARLVTSSPVAQHAGIAAPDPSRVAALGAILEAEIKDAADARDLELRVYVYYLPVYLWAHALLEEHRRSGERRPMFIGFSCPQGGGKTTMVTFLAKLFASEGRVCGGASLDDFYLTYEEQTALAGEYAGNDLLEFRGNPGTHDVEMLCGMMDQVGKFGTAESPGFVEVPQYDKTRHGGRGDRKPMEKAERLEEDCEVFLLEGWCMGFQAKGKGFDFEGHGKGDLRVVDGFLEKFAQIYERLHALLVVEVNDLKCVYEWREQPEKESRDAGKGAMSKAEVIDFVRRFMDGYQMYTPDLYNKKLSVVKNELHLKINRERKLCEEEYGTGYKEI